jgi:SAM-dependent methyltransferase
MDPVLWRERARSFGAVARRYDEFRPTYPDEAIRWAFAALDTDVLGNRGVPGDDVGVADIGAGTGIMTRVLVRLGYRVTAVEPDDRMREYLTEAMAGHAVRVVRGSAEDLPLGTGEVHGAIAAQAYHWFDKDRAHPELARVIRSGGVIAIVWNELDIDVDWVHAYSVVIDHGIELHSDEAENLELGPDFEPLEQRVFRHSVSLAPAGLGELAKTRSAFLTASTDQRSAMLAGIDEIARTHPALAGRPNIAVPYLTRVFRAARR